MARAMMGVFSAAWAILLAMSAEAQPRGEVVEWPTKPPSAAQRPVTEAFFGIKLADPYRYMETAGHAETLAWMKAQGRAYAHGSGRDPCPCGLPAQAQ
jgi:hypothetical protein